MSWQDKKACLFFAAAFFLSTAVFAEEEKPTERIRLSTKGYYKNIAATSRSLTNNKPFFSDTQRFRIEPTIDIGATRICIAYDNEMITGGFLRTSDFDLVKQRDEKNLDWWDAQWTLVDERGIYYKTSLYRAYIRYYDPRYQIIVGKQMIGWGRSHFWSPMDLFNPKSPLDIEKDERVGVDAVNVNASITDLLDLDLVYVPYGTLAKSSFAVRTLYRIANYDVFLMGGQFKKDNVIGACFDGYLGGAGIRGEFTYTWEHSGKKYFRGVVGAEYTFNNKLRMSAEYFFNGAAEDVDRYSFLSSYQYSQKMLTLKKNLIGAQVGYDLTPLLKWDNYAIFDMNGKSLFINPELKYNMRPNLDITLGAQAFWGTNDSEFGSYKDLYYAELKDYF